MDRTSLKKLKVMKSFMMEIGNIVAHFVALLVVVLGAFGVFWVAMKIIWALM